MLAAMSVRRLRPALIAILFGAALAFSSVPAVAEFHGNVKSHVFHKSSCRYFDCASCSEVFETAQEARDAGYRPCGTCKPAGKESRPRIAAGFVGNSKSHVFHKASCHNAGCKNCGAVFGSRDDAIRAGYRPGKCCRP